MSFKFNGSCYTWTNPCLYIISLVVEKVRKKSSQAWRYTFSFHSTEFWFIIILIYSYIPELKYDRSFFFIYFLHRQSCGLFNIEVLTMSFSNHICDVMNEILKYTRLYERLTLKWFPPVKAYMVFMVVNSLRPQWFVYMKIVSYVYSSSIDKWETILVDFVRQVRDEVRR